MVNQGVAAQLNIPQSKLSTIVYAQQIIVSRIITYMENNNGCPSMSWVKASHANVLGTSFRPCINVAVEINRTPGNANGCSTEFRPKHNCDYISNSVYRFSTPEVTCNAADLPDIIVAAADPDIFAANGSVPWNFGTGVAATASEQQNVLIRDGFNYNHSAGPAVPATTVVTTGNGVLNIRNAATSLSIFGGISYTYVDRFHNFIAGPSGLALAPNADGYALDAAGAPQTGSRVQRANYVRMADLPGIKYIREAQFIIESTEIDKYTHNRVLNHYKTRILRHSDKNVFDKLIGQGLPQEFPSEVISVPGTQFNFGEGATSSYYVQEHRKYTFDSPQTPMATQPRRELWIPLFFQHTLKRCDAFAAALTSDADICYRFTTARLSELFYAVPGQTFIREYVEFYNSANLDVGTIDDPSRVHERFIPMLVPNSVPQFGALDACDNKHELLQYFLYLDDAIHYVLICRISFELIRYFRDTIHCIGTECDQVDLELKNSSFPIEYMYISDIPKVNNDESLYTTARNWHRIGHQHQTPVHKYIRSSHVDRVTGNYTVENRMAEHGFVQKEVGIIKTLAIRVHETDYYQRLDRRFYSEWKYCVYNNGLWHNDDSQLYPLLVSFSQKPGAHQIYGIAAVTRARKVQYTIELEAAFTGYMLPDGISGPLVPVPSASKIDIVVEQQIINFVLSSDGVASPRYT